MKSTEYLFIYDGKGWWLKLTGAEQLIDYHKQTGSRYEGAMRLYMKMKQEGKEFSNLLDGLTDMIHGKDVSKDV